MRGASLRGDQIRAGDRFAVRLERTLRVPNDGRVYPLPPSLGPFPLYRTRDYAATKGAAGRGEFFVPLYQWEALWLSFEAEEWKPNAVQVAAGGVNVLTGEPFPSPLCIDPQNYLVCPLQPWLDGIRTESGSVRQFVAASPGERITLEEQIAGSSGRGGLQLRVYEPRPGVFPARKPKGFDSAALYSESLPGELGVAGGGAIEQKVYPDPHGLEAWDRKNFIDVTILIVNSTEFRAITGADPPPSPISAADYERTGLPWFKLYDEELRDLSGAPRLKGLKTVRRNEDSAAATPVRGIGRGKRSPKRRS